MADTTGLEPATSAVTVQRSKPTELRIQIKLFISFARRIILIIFYIANFFLSFFEKLNFKNKKNKKILFFINFLKTLQILDNSKLLYFLELINFVLFQNKLKYFLKYFLKKALFPYLDFHYLIHNKLEY